MSGKVDIIKADPSNSIRRSGKTINRKKVAAYCRVSTDHEEQKTSYRSQVEYYTDLIEKNPEWTLAGIYADEGITGTQVTKREEFLRMIQACCEGEIDMVITKSISRFARNTLDTLKYVRMLKTKNIAVYFEDEKINTLSMDGELLLVVLSSVAQQEVENISANVRKGLAMKMSRGELVGTPKAFGYDYDEETKQISINPEEAEIVKYIFQRYVEGAGSRVISHELADKGVKAPYGSTRWSESTILRMIRNEKYTGDLLQGKTFTFDPITKRRLLNQGEADQYYLKDHHEAIISRELFDQAQYVLKRRAEPLHNPMVNQRDYRTLYSRKHALSGMIRCGFCGATFSRRQWHSNTKYEKIMWSCSTLARFGRVYCPETKQIEEAAITSAFVESYKIITQDNQDVLQEFLDRTEHVLNTKHSDKSNVAIQQQISNLKTKMNKLVDLRLENNVDNDTYLKKKKEIEYRIKRAEAQLTSAEDAKIERQALKKRISSMRKMLKDGCIIKEFDRQVFESIVDYVIIGGYDDQGNADPFKITFVYKTGIEDNKDIQQFKPKRMNVAKRLQSKVQFESNELPSSLSSDSREL